MRPVSAAWESTIRGTHKAVYKAVLCDTFQTTTQPVGTKLKVIGGKVTVDGLADVRSTADIEIEGTGLWPRRASDPLGPYGNEIYLARGVQYSDTEVEMVGLGYFRIEGAEQTEDLPDGPIRIGLADRMKAIVEGRLLEPRQYVAGETLGNIVNDLVTEIYPDAVIEWDDSSDLATLTRDVIVEEDRFGFLDDVIRSRGKIWYWDHKGALVIKDLPDPSKPVFTVNAGKHGVLVEMSRKVTRQGVYNAVVASGEAGDIDTPARGVAIDNNPLSPTYFHGRFGKVPRFYSSPLLFTDAQARQAAQTILMKQLGVPYLVDFGAVPNPALEPFDPVKVKYSDREAYEIHVLERIDIPLGPGVMTSTTREKSHVMIATSS